MLAGVYIQLPSSSSSSSSSTSAPSGFRLLGALSNEKPSAIFKVGPQAQNDIRYYAQGEHLAGGGSSSRGGAIEEDEMIDIVDTEPGNNNNPATGGPGVTVGISIEPAVALTGQLAALSSTQPLTSSALVVARPPPPPTALSTKVLAQRIIKNAFNFLASFAGMTGAGGEEVVPLRSFRDWWVKFERRVENEPGFLERDGDG